MRLALILAVVVFVALCALTASTLASTARAEVSHVLAGGAR